MAPAAGAKQPHPTDAHSRARPYVPSYKRNGTLLNTKQFIIIVSIFLFLCSRLTFTEPATTVASTRMLIGDTAASMTRDSTTITPNPQGIVMRPREIMVKAKVQRSIRKWTFHTSARGVRM